MSAAPLRDDPIIDWLEELEAISPEHLSPAALARVLGVLDSFAAEDGHLPHSASRVRARLAARVAGQASSEVLLQSEQGVRFSRDRHLLPVQGAAAS